MDLLAYLGMCSLLCFNHSYCCLQWLSSDRLGSIIAPWHKSPCVCSQWHTRQTGEGWWTMLMRIMIMLLNVDWMMVVIPFWPTNIGEDQICSWKWWGQFFWKLWWRWCRKDLEDIDDCNSDEHEDDYDNMRMTMMMIIMNMNMNKSQK